MVGLGDHLSYEDSWNGNDDPKLGAVVDSKSPQLTPPKTNMEPENDGF